MKKIIAIILTCILGVASFPCAASAEEIGNNGIFGVITDETGEVVEVIPMPKTIYLDKAFTLAPGYSLTTYQYESPQYLVVGFDFGSDTTRNRRVLVEIYGSSTIGGDNRTLMKSHTFSTNVEDNEGSEYFSSAIVDEVTLVAYSTPQMPYLNGKYTNKSSLSLELHVLVASF